MLPASLVRSAVLVCAALLTTVLTPMTASAGGVPVLSAVSVAHAGHVTGKAVTDFPFLRLRLKAAGTTMRETINPAGAATPVDFDFTTWGLGTVTIEATSCATDTLCTGPSYTTESITPLKVTPTITVSDALLGPDEPTTSVTVADPDGGGALLATWHNGNEEYWLDRNGVTELPLGADEADELVVRRCWSQTVRKCNTQVLIPLVVNRRAEATLTTARFKRDGDPATADGSLQLTNLDPLPEGTEVSLSWELMDYSNDLSPTGYVGSSSGSISADGTVALPVDFTGVWPGLYQLDATISYFDPSVDALLTGDLKQPNRITVYLHDYDQLTLGRTVKAAKYDAAFVGKCSRLEKPASRGWKGSAELQSGVRCPGKSWRKSGVMVTYRMKLPSTDKLGTVRVRVRGGAAKGHRGSTALLQLRAQADPFQKVELGGPLAWRGLSVATAPTDSWLTWRVRVRNGARYDLQKFRVVVTYYRINDA